MYGWVEVEEKMTGFPIDLWDLLQKWSIFQEKKDMTNI